MKSAQLVEFSSRPDKCIRHSSKSRASCLSKKTALEARDLVLQAVEDGEALVHDQHPGGVSYIMPATGSELVLNSGA